MRTGRLVLNIEIAFLTLATLALTNLVHAESSAKMSLDDFLKKAQLQNQKYQSAEQSAQAAKIKMGASGLDLEPTLNIQYSKSSDESQPNALGSKTELESKSISLSKKFSTGTSLTLSSGLNDINVTSPTVPTLDKYSTGNLGVSIRQSVWKDSFGANSRRVLNRENKTYELEYRAAELERRRVLIQFESNFWDYLMAQEDLKLKKENLDRSTKLDRWTLKRVSNGISDQADSMNAKALVALRTLQMQSAEDELKAQEAILRDTLELAENEPIPVLVGDLEKSRSHIDTIANKTNVLPISAILAQLEAQVKALVAEEKLESQKPDLALFGSYTSNSFDRESSQALSKIDDGKLPKSQVGVSLTMPIGTGAKGSFVDAANGEARAAERRAVKEISLGKTNWKEFLRRYEAVKKNVITLGEVAKYQESRARAEREKFGKGRTVTANVVTAETDSAEAESTLLKARSNLRKLEASIVMFEPYQ